MMRKSLALATWCVLAVSPIFTILRLSSLGISHYEWNALFAHGIVTTRLLQIISYVVILLAWFVTVGTYIQGIRIRRHPWHYLEKQSLLPMCGVALAGFLSMGSKTVDTPTDSLPIGIEISSLVTPAMASASAVSAVRKFRVDSGHGGVAVTVDRSVHIFSASESSVVLSEATDVDDDQLSMPEWEVVVRVFGYPQVENKQGVVGEFRKKKSLELLLWLSLNRDRPRRSAARTAMWEADISDSSFATIVSEMRRGLSDLCPSVPARDWAPPTFNDEIVISNRVVTDAELLTHAVQEFQRDPSTGNQLISELEKIRDLPFSGAHFVWPDSDGTTTRLVILAAHAAREAAYWAFENKDWQSVTTAVTAGLRMLPGDEEFLDLQRLVLQSVARPLH